MESESKSDKISEKHIHIVLINSDGILKYHCTVCGAYFRSRSQKYYHISCKEGNSKRYPCIECPKSFASRSHLKYHKESHSAQLYKCSLCEKLFKNQFICEKHKKSHFVEKPKKCSYKKKPMSEREHLICSKCEKSFLQKSRFEDHQKKCLSNKSFICQICNKHFQRNSTLRLHMNRHTKLNVSRCALCFQVFGDMAALKRHSKIHDGNTAKYKCVECDVMTVRKDNMQRHVRSMHGNKSFEECVELCKNFNTVTISSQPETQNIENSSVIKCIGNVEPVTIPCSEANTSSFSEQINQYNPIEMYRKIINDGAIEDISENQIVNELAVEKSQDQSDDESQIIENNVNSLSSSSLHLSNITHWKKEFKYTYDLQYY